jgi:urocanate hydratase
MEQSASRRQFDVLRLYGDLVSDREDWSGALVLACGPCAEIVPTAVSIANGTTLWLTDAAADARAAMRRGAVDFVVNSLDEALRTLKNQIRQGRPLGVALTGDVASVLEEIVERGVLPDRMFGHAAMLDASQSRASIDSLQASGMDFRYGPYQGTDGGRWQRATMIVGRNRSYAYFVQAESLPRLREIDVRLLATLAEGDIPRRRWLQRLPRYVRDSVEGGRWVWLAEEEFDGLRDTLPISPEALP